MNESELSPRLAWAEEVALQVGDLLLSGFRSGLESEEKPRGIVTDLDRRAEELIVRQLQAAFPGDGLLAEEGSRLQSESGYRWIVDPLDGTTNYVSGLPHFAVSLACVREDESLVGVVHAPVSAETFKVAKGSVAMGPDGPLSVSRTAALNKAVILLNKCYLPASVLWESTSNLLGNIRAFRYLGCISLDICYVAAGRVDGLVLLPATPWDVAAGLAVLEASGAAYAGLDGHPVRVDQKTGLVASAPDLMDPLLSLINSGPAS